MNTCFAERREGRWTSLASTLPLVVALVASVARADAQRAAPAERAAVLATLERETEAFCNRDLDAWREQWLHTATTSKLYAGDVAFEELIGWAAVDSFTRAHIERHPDPLPVAQTTPQPEVAFFGEAALVTYAKEVEGGTAREVRLLAEVDGAWRIVRMETLYHADDKH